MTGLRPLARGFCYPQAEWFSLSLGNNRDGTLITWEEWDELVAAVTALRTIAQKTVKLEDAAVAPQ